MKDKDAMTTLDTLVVGAGQAGIGISYFLRQNHREHIVLERGEIGESWLSQRWDSFKLNTPNFMNVLPGLPYEGTEPDGFWRRDELIHYFQKYINYFHLPVRTGVNVISVRQIEDKSLFIVKTIDRNNVQESFLSRSVVLASGIQNTPKFPTVNNRVPKYIRQLHTANYRNAAELPSGAIVVVGSGQSGCQIAEDLLFTGRRVYLCTSKVGRAPRRYRGRDLLEWWVDMKNLDVKFTDLEDKLISHAAQPQISGLGRYGHTISLQHLARQGVIVLGHLMDVEADTLILNDDAATHIHFADQFSQQLKNDIDTYIHKAGIVPPALEDDPADLPDPLAEYASPLRHLNLRNAKISTIIWATGFTGDFSWIHLPILDREGKPIHRRGVSPIRGLYFIGFPWLNSRKSGIIYGMEEDARYIMSAITKQLG
jgi:putative flavoprotein involved in K+ transport